MVYNPGGFGGFPTSTGMAFEVGGVLNFECMSHVFVIVGHLSFERVTF